MSKEAMAKLIVTGAALIVAAMIIALLAGCKNVQRYEHYVNGQLVAVYYYDDSFTLGTSEGDGKTLIEVNGLKGGF